MKDKKTPLIRPNVHQTMKFTSQTPFWEFVFPFLWVLFSGEALKQAYAIMHGQPMARQLWERDVSWLLPLINNKVYFGSLWQWVWLTKTASALWIYRGKVNWEPYKRSFIPDLLVTLLFFAIYYAKETFFLYTGFRLSGHFLICILTSAMMTNEASNSRRYLGAKWIPFLAVLMSYYNYFSLFFTAFIYHSFLEGFSGTCCGLLISHIAYYKL